MTDPIAVPLAALLVIVIVGGGLMLLAIHTQQGRVDGLIEARDAADKRADAVAEELHGRIDDLVSYVVELRDAVADHLDQDDAPQPDPGPATSPAADAIDAGHEELVTRQPGRHRFRSNVAQEQP